MGCCQEVELMEITECVIKLGGLPLAQSFSWDTKSGTQGI